MKAIGIFSGKGGVGKSTMTGLLALALAQKRRVAILDFDINTPSMPVLFGGRSEVGNIRLISTGYGDNNPLTFMSSVAKKVMLGMVRQVKEMKPKPDIVLIDMPPGFTDVHLEVCTKLKPSSFVMVIQPNNLSKQDAVRAGQFILQMKIPIAGVISNMEGGVFGESAKILNLKTLAHVPLQEDIASYGNSGKLDKLKDNPLAKISEVLYQKASEINWEFPKFEHDFEGPELDVVKGMFKMADRETHRFYGLKTWDWVNGQLNSLDINACMYMGQRGGDRFLEMNDAHTIRKMVENIGPDGTGLFMVLRPPGCEVNLYPGEVGVGRLIIPDRQESYYGVPRIGYPTDKGEVHLFPHEVSAFDIKTLTSLQGSGELVATNLSPVRYVPSSKMLREISNAYCGERGLTRISRDWKEDYLRLGVAL